MKQYICLTCGKRFLDRHYQKEGRKYCSRECYPAGSFWLGRNHKPETIEKMRVSARNRKENPERIRNLIKRNRKGRGKKREPCPKWLKEKLKKLKTGKKRSDLDKKKMRDSWTDERRRIYSKRMKDFQTLERRQKARERLQRVKPWLYLDRSNSKRTIIEKILARILDELGLEHEPQKFLYYFYVDEYLSQYRLVIEANGNYWHSRDDQRKKDLSKRAYLESRGEKVLFLWGSDLKKHPDSCKKIIMEAVKSVEENSLVKSP